MEQITEKTSSPSSSSMEALLFQVQGVSSINTQKLQTNNLDAHNNGGRKKHCRIPVTKRAAQAKLEKHPSCFRKAHRAPSPTPAAMKQILLLRPISSSLKSSISSGPVSHKTAKTFRGMKSHFLTKDRILKTQLVPRIKAHSNRMNPTTDQDKEEAAPCPASPPEQDHMGTSEEHEVCAINKYNEQREMNDGENLQEEDKDEKLIDKQNIICMVKRRQERTENIATNSDEEIKKLESKQSVENAGMKIEATAYSDVMKKADSKLAEMKNSEHLKL